MAIYVLDSNFFIQAHRFTYPIDIATGFWNKVKDLAQEGTIVSIDKVKEELYKNNDALKTWCKENLPRTFFKDSSDTMIQYSQVVSWAMSRSDHYQQKAIEAFLDADEADAFLVAFALADLKNRFIVTQEVSKPQQRNKVKIPDCCKALGVRYLNTIDMFRELGETF